jgi:hypothetical protein
MKRICAFVALIGSAAICLAADSNEKVPAAMRDARRLVECMKAFDPVCSVALTYSKFLEDRGMPHDYMVKSVTELDAKLKSIGAKYTRFELIAPSTTYSGDGRDYTFVPYEQMLETGPMRGGLKAYFIGVSQDNGNSWQFVDGVKTTPANIRIVMPSYAGQPLPSVGPLDLSK